MKYDMHDYTSSEQLLREVETMNSFGVRLTGSPAHKAYIESLKSQIREMGLPVYSDPYFFNRWEAKSASLVLHDVNGNEEIPISSVFPYSGETAADGVTAELVMLDG